MANPAPTKTDTSHATDRQIFDRPAWTSWIAAASCEAELRAGLAQLAARLSLSREQSPLFDLFSEKLLRGFVAADAPDPGDGWDSGKSAALDHLLRLEIAAGRFLGAIEETRETLARLYAILDPRQRQIVDSALASERP